MPFNIPKLVTVAISTLRSSDCTAEERNKDAVFTTVREDYWKEQRCQSHWNVWLDARRQDDLKLDLPQGATAPRVTQRIREN